ncbi:twin-arginine translocation signal domain-containing protein [Brevifollis gellanilyticus]|uniref:Peptidylglycine monooxygenase n=1 Tax=Brevifollis gellanilyticus TaxID=748831 RepID=A0A512MBA8_9BACT|nr:twin-arginine translocation signal domain-containing protein [Brevifollis gellanilyticus]GEP44008.1 peptidylglycine monooxygenase [Brevifollis gellanilyticus]
MTPVTSRRRFLQTSAAGVVAGFPFIRAADAPVLGQGEFKYRVVPGWGALDDKTPVKNCHGIVRDREGHLILLTDHTANNVIIYDKAGKMLSKWGTQFPGAHGLSIVKESEREVLFITCLQTHRVVKTTLDGEVLQEWRWPESTGKYAKEADYKPSWTLHLADGSFFVLDGYGKDFITRYDASGKLVSIFGGQEGGITHWGPHGGMSDEDVPGSSNLLIAMSDQQYLLRLSYDGKKLAQIDLPGGNPRQIRKHETNYFVAHLADNWPKDRNSRGFISVLDVNLQVISNVAGTAPSYDDGAKLKPMKHQEDVFMHPHDLIVDNEHSLYVAQFASGNTVPIKLERV